ncbi:flagellar export chaperone FliS [Timonella sp. A28]|uniref:flagellar export chaperone FliS n=1 Tax=Timonella sp. A28 TaxID=3442640 RepID=UPI003EB7CFF1
MNYSSSRDEYLTNAVMSASPAKLLIMLYDRAILDVRRAEHETENGNATQASQHLIHAQDIVTELTNSLDTTVWDGAKQLQALYLHLYSALVAANLSKHADEMRECREVLEELRETWIEAATRAAGIPEPESVPAVPAKTPAFAGGSGVGLGDLGVG